jgi:hypothetical protein
VSTVADLIIGTWQRASFEQRFHEVLQGLQSDGLRTCSGCLARKFVSLARRALLSDYHFSLPNTGIFVNVNGQSPPCCVEIL